MWNERNSITLSKICTAAFFVLLIALAGSAPWLVEKILSHSRTGLLELKTYFLITIYAGCLPAAVLLKSLFSLLQRIDQNQVFVRKNVEGLRLISWCCFIGAGIALVSTVYYIPWVMPGLAAAFIGLIVRVIKNVIKRAIALQDDADLTI